MAAVPPASGQEAPPQQQQQPAPSPQAPPQIKVVGPGDAFSIALFSWFPNGSPVLRRGSPAVSSLDFTGAKPYAPGARISIPAGANNAVRLSYFQARGAGNRIAAGDPAFFDQGYKTGDALSTSYKVQTGKVSFDYTSWPYPVNNSKFLLKTLWQVQYIGVSGEIDAPLKAAADGGAHDTRGKRWFIYPAFGLGIEERISNNLRIELQASGFYIPRRPSLWDANGALTYRMGKWEIVAGYRGLHFKTSPNDDHYFRGTLSGGFAGLQYRWE